MTDNKYVKICESQYWLHCKIEAVNGITDYSYLVPFNIRSLYANIPHTEGIESVRKYLAKI